MERMEAALGGHIIEGIPPTPFPFLEMASLAADM